MKNKEASAIINQYGEIVRIVPENQNSSVTAKAFIQPLRIKDRRNIFGEYLDIGADNNDQYLYIGEPSARLDLFPLDTVVELGKEKYVMKSSEKIVIKGEIIYIRAILHKCTC